MTNEMKRYCLQLTVIIVIFAVFSGCTSSEPTVYAPEPLPERLAVLPRQAEVTCQNDPILDRGAVRLWSLPGRSLPDSDSGVSGFRGDEVGSIEPCEQIQITESYWDPYGAKYWVKIENNDLTGWVPLDLISVE